MTVTSHTPGRVNSGGTRHLLGTFGGVFTPSILTILGIILFRRLGYVVGNAGVLPALGMLGVEAVEFGVDRLADPADLIGRHIALEDGVAIAAVFGEVFVD